MSFTDESITYILKIQKIEQYFSEQLCYYKRCGKLLLCDYLIIFSIADVNPA